MPNYNMPYITPEDPEFLISILGLVLIVSLIISLIISAVIFVLQAIGVYKLSKNRGYKKAWLAWIPVLNSYVIGGIYDDINRCSGKRSNYRVILLIGKFIVSIFNFTILIILAANLPNIIKTLLLQMQTPTQFYYDIISFQILTWVNIAFTIVFMVFTFIAIFKIYKDYDEKNYTIYIVLSILFNFTPLFLFAIRNKKSISRFYAQMNCDNPYATPQNQFAYNNFQNPPTQL